MKVSELIELLQMSIIDNDGEDMEVQMVYQQNWPLCSKIHNVKVMNEDAKSLKEDKENVLEEFKAGHMSHEEYNNAVAELDRMLKDKPNIVYIVEGSHVGYGSRDAWEED
jgi:hypothetical protein